MSELTKILESKCVRTCGT